MNKNYWLSLSKQVINGYRLSKEEALSILTSPDNEIEYLLEAAEEIRYHFFGNKVRIHVLKNAKSGKCPEDCKFCSQSIRFNTAIPTYDLETIEEIVSSAEKAYENGAYTYCIVTATRGPNTKVLQTVTKAAEIIKQKYPTKKICASLGLLKEGQAEKLKESGVDRYNHNLESSESFYSNVCTTHSWQDRLKTVLRAKKAGLEICCGGIIGMGEEIVDRVYLALSLSKLNVESIPVNFLDPRPGTPLDTLPLVEEEVALKTLILFRFTNPKADIRASAGREKVFNKRRTDIIKVATSIFSSGYLTTCGNPIEKDIDNLTKSGFEIVV